MFLIRIFIRDVATTNAIRLASVWLITLLIAVLGCCWAADVPIEEIRKGCDINLNFESIDEFHNFIKHYKTLDEEQLKAAAVSKDCRSDRDAILEVESLIIKEDVCSPEHIDGIIDYHKKYFKPSRLLGLGKKITHKFFKKYAIQVAYICKKNLINNLELARIELQDVNKTIEQAREKVYNEEPTIKSNIKLIQEQPDVPSATNVRPKDEAELTMGEYREALVKLQRPEDILTFDPEECKGSKKHTTMVTMDKLQIFFKPAMMCHQLHRYYEGSVLSIARLANHGYLAIDQELDETIAKDPRIRDWVLAVQICEPMLFMNTQEIKGDTAIINTCSDKVLAIETLVYPDVIDGDLDTRLLEELVPKSKPTRAEAQEIMRSAYKRMAKTNVINQLKAGASKRSIFAKSLSLLKKQDAGLDFAKSDPTMKARSLSKFSIQLTGDMSAMSTKGTTTEQQERYVKRDLTDDESYELLKNFVDEKHANRKSEQSDNNIDSPVAFVDPLSALATSLTVLAIMLSFEWLFFIVMTLAARICTHFHFNFENLLTFPPKFLSWSDADFASYNAKMEAMDEDDFFDYDELNDDEKHQRNMLNQLFGRPPPMVYRD